MDEGGLEVIGLAPDGAEERWRHDLAGRLVEYRDASGRVRRYGHDQAGRLGNIVEGAEAVGDAPAIASGEGVRCDGAGRVVQQTVA